MRKNIEQRLSAMEKRTAFATRKWVSVTCPHRLYLGEEYPCEDCEQTREVREQNGLIMCVKYVMPGKREH